MLATDHVSVSSASEGKRVKFELLSLSLKRTTGGIQITAHGHETLEALFRDAAPRDVYGEDPSKPLTEGVGTWGNIELYAIGSDNTFRNNFHCTADDGMSYCAAFRGSSGFYTSLGRPDDSGSYPLNLAWLRAVGLSSPEGVRFLTPALMGPQDANKWASVVVKVVDKLWREKLQPYHITVRVTVDTVVTV